MNSSKPFMKRIELTNGDGIRGRPTNGGSAGGPEPHLMTSPNGLVAIRDGDEVIFLIGPDGRDLNHKMAVGKRERTESIREVIQSGEGNFVAATRVEGFDVDGASKPDRSARRNRSLRAKK